MTTVHWNKLTAALTGRIRYRVARAGVLFVFAMVLVGVAAAVSANNLLFLIVAAMLTTLLISGLVSRLVLAGLELELVLPEHISARRKTAARMRLRNTKRWMPSFSIHVAGDGASRILDVPVYFPVAPGGRALEEPVDVVFPRRGAHVEKLFLFSTSFPFGFLEKTALVTLRRETVVYPSIDPQPGFEELLTGIMGEIESNARGLGTDFYRIRPYEHSESARYVDWKSTAHTGDLQVREFARDERLTVEIFLDRSAGAPPQWFEQAVECCAFLAWELARQNLTVTVYSQGFRARCPDEDDVYTILKFLAFAEPQLNRRRFPPSDSTSFQILLSTAPESFLDEGWHPARVLGLDAFAAVEPEAGAGASLRPT
jgi:uncharacterized protein (DUF58 family)